MKLILILVCTTAWLPAAMAKARLHGDIKFHLELAMQTNDARGIAAYVEDAITVEYQDTRTSKKKPEVEKVFAVFFAQNKCKSFKIDNQGTYKNLTRHMEGVYLATNSKKFQVYFEALYDEKEAHHHLSRVTIEKID